MVKTGGSRQYIPYLIIAVLSILVYFNALNNPFQYDDEPDIVKNTFLEKWENIPQFFTGTTFYRDEIIKADHYRPLVYLTYSINKIVGGNSPCGYHVVNLAFHIGSAIMLYLIIKAMLVSSEQLAVNSEQSAVSSKQLTVNSEQLAVSSKQIADSRFKGFSAYCSLFTSHYIALASALIFAVHPFNSEVVNYITARSSVMSGFFYLLAFWCWVKYRQSAVNSEQSAVSRFKDFSAHCSLFTVYYIGSLLAFLMGMLSKEVVITLPIVLWLYDIYFVHPLRPPHSSFRTLYNWRTYLPYLPFVCIVVIPALVLRIIYWGKVVPSFKRSMMVQLYTELPVLVKHLRLFAFPAGLNVDHYSAVYQNFFSWPVVLSAMIIILYLILAVAAYMARSGVWRIASFFMIWFFIVLLPTIVIPLNAIFQENRGYLAVITFSVFAGIMLGRLSGIRGGALRYVPAVVLIVIVFCYGAGTIYRNSMWRTGMSLWSDAVAKSPNSPRAHANLGTEYSRAGNSERAIEHFMTALRFPDPEDRVLMANIHYNLGTVYQQTGRDETAVKEYQVASEISPSDFRPYYNLGIIYQKRGSIEAAIESYKRVIRTNRSHFKSYHNLGLLYHNLGDLALAEEFYKMVLSLNPDYSRSMINLAVLYERKGDLKKAKELLMEAARKNPGDSRIQENIKTLDDRLISSPLP